MVVAEGVCSDTANVLVRVNPLPEVFAGEDTTVIYGTRAYLNGQAAQDIVWEPALYLDCPECAEHQAFRLLQPLIVSRQRMSMAVLLLIAL